MPVQGKYADRIEAGFRLVEELEKFRNQDAVVLAVPRGGIPVAYVVSLELKLPLDIVLIKKLGHPRHKEYAIGAVSLSDRILFPQEEVSDLYINTETDRIRERLREMNDKFKGNAPPQPIQGKTVILVDDGIATGRTLESAISLISKSNPSSIVVAAPVASLEAVNHLARQVDEVICPWIAGLLDGIGAFYEDFTQVSDEEVTKYLKKSALAGN